MNSPVLKFWFGRVAVNHHYLNRNIDQSRITFLAPRKADKIGLVLIAKLRPISLQEPSTTLLWMLFSIWYGCILKNSSKNQIVMRTLSPGDKIELHVMDRSPLFELSMLCLLTSRVRRISNMAICRLANHMARSSATE